MEEQGNLDCPPLLVNVGRFTEGRLCSLRTHERKRQRLLGHSRVSHQYEGPLPRC
jgi:hypothetical protein